jgi:hypothetical protein
MPRPGLRGAAPALLACALLAAPRGARACAVCGAGDPTLTLMGADRPFAGRLRIAADLRVGSARVGALGGAAGEIEIVEQRLDLAAAYAPLPSLFVSLSFPMLRRQATLLRDASTTTTGTPGDLELRARYVAWSGYAGGVRHQLAIHGGLKLPTAPVQRDASGATLPAEIQPGTGAISPLAGAFYGVSSGPWSFSTSVTLYLPFQVRQGPHATDSLRTTSGLQLQPLRALAGRLGFDTRLDSTAEANGQLDPDSGGFIGYVAAEIIWSPVTDVLLVAGARFPAVQALHGAHHESTVFSAGVTYDL